jgi:uncharacterized metal-binding protein YceD (DUF177 family)
MTLKIAIGGLFAPDGSSEKIHLKFSEPFSISAELGATALSELQGELELFRLKEDVVVLIRTAEITVELQCARCLGNKNLKIKFPNIDQIFYSKKSDVLGEENFFIDHKNGTINVTPFLEQELYVRIPVPFLHEEGECDPKMLQKIKEYDQEVLPSPLAELKNFLPKKKENEK